MVSCNLSGVFHIQRFDKKYVLSGRDGKSEDEKDNFLRCHYIHLIRSRLCVFWHVGHRQGFSKLLIKKKCPFPLKELSRISHASLFPALAVVWQLLLDLLRLQSSQSHPSPPSSPLSPRVWLDREGGGGPLSLFSLSLCSLMFLIDSMWQLHGRLQSHPKVDHVAFLPALLHPTVPLRLVCFPPTSRTTQETLGTFISKQAPCSSSSPLLCPGCSVEQNVWDFTDL